MIQDLLNKLSPLDVKNIAFDMKKGTIRVELQDNRLIQFEDVTSFFYTDEEVSYQTNLELKPIVYDAAGFDALFSSFEDMDDDESYSVPNFSLCVDDRSMLIEAGKIQIFGNTYILTERMH